MLNKIKAGIANLALKFISVEEKLSYMFLETFPKNVRPIVILPAVNSVMRYIVHKLNKQSIHGLVYNGKLNNIEVSVIQTNMGSPSTAMIMEVLKNCHCKVAIRIDYCGGLKTTLVGNRPVETGLKIGSVVIPKTVFLTDGTSFQYLQKNIKQPIGNSLLHNHASDTIETWKYPTLEGKYWAADSPESLYTIFKKNLEEQNRRERPDILWSSDSLFCETPDAINTWRLQGCNSVDMESCAIYLLGALYKIPAISLLGVSNILDVDELNLMKVNKIHPGIFESLDAIYNRLANCLPIIQQELVEKT
jgi:purine-nucleoside phosphorylase